MTTPRRYTRNPITEAIIDFRVELPDGVTAEDLEKCHDPAYPSKDVLGETVGQFEIEDNPSATTTSRLVGFLFKALDEKQLYQVRLSGCAIHRLAPYVGWETFRKEAMRLWSVYRRVTRPLKLTRLAVRYVNRLDIPLGAEMQDYLRTSPEVSPDLPQVLGNFFMRVTIPQPDIQGTLILNEAAIPPASPDVASIVLDIDLFSTTNLQQDDDWIGEYLERVRHRKNEIFEACITERMRELFQ